MAESEWDQIARAAWEAKDIEAVSGHLSELMAALAEAEKHPEATDEFREVLRGFSAALPNLKSGDLENVLPALTVVAARAQRRLLKIMNAQEGVRLLEVALGLAYTAGRYSREDTP